MGDIGLYDAIVSIASVLVLVPETLILVLLFLRYATEGPDHPMKRLRYEAGNPPSGEARISALYQYFGYILIFVALDPVFMLLFLLPSLTGRWMDAVMLSLASVLILLPPLAYAVRYARRREYWSL
jgi:NADH-quinone oxidoreductase subunit A